MSAGDPAKAAHPAAQWAIEAGFNPEQVDCTTTVVLKILDGKCKMLPGEMAAIMAIYDVVIGDAVIDAVIGDAVIGDASTRQFGKEVHDAIYAMRFHPDSDAQDRIHRLRVLAEATIPKPVMKHYKAFLRDGLFG